MTTEQAVVDETKAAARPDAAVDGAQDDGIEKLLSEFEQKTQPASPPKPKAETQTDSAAVIAERMAALENRFNQEDIKKETDEIFAGLELDQEFKESWLNSQAVKYPAALHAWNNRRADPATWNKWRKEISKTAQVKLAPFKKADIDPNATADRDAVAAAVRGASAKVTAEPAPNLGRMSDAELRKYTLENFGF